MQPLRFGRFEVTETLPSGPLGPVHRARDVETGQTVELRVLQVFADLPEVERKTAGHGFIADARAAAGLHHPSLIPVVDAGEQDGVFFLASELVQADSLEGHCAAPELLPVPAIVEMLAAVGEALDHVHRKGVMHRNVTPSNLLRVGETSVRLGGVGLSRALQAQHARDGQLQGTPGYLSPELIRGRPADGRSDLFSLGVVLFELLTGARPFPGDSTSSILYRVVNEPPLCGASLSRAVPPSLEAFVARALAKDPQERFEDGARFAAELRRSGSIGLPKEQVVQRSVSGPALPAEARPRGESPPPELPPPVRSRRKRRGSPLPYFLGLVLLLSVLGIAAYINRDRWIPVVESVPEEVWLETRVRTEPAGLEVLLDGIPVTQDQAGLVRFLGTPPFGTLSASVGCRTVEHTLQPTDAMGDVVLVADPESLSWRLDPGVEGASATLNGAAVETPPVDLEFDLCSDTELVVDAAGFRTARMTIPARATPLEARTLLDSLQLEAIPRGKLELPQTEFQVVYYVDGKRLGSSARELELLEGEHTIRVKNESYWLDVRRKVTIEGGKTLRPDLGLPPLTTLSVQAFPANCKVHLRQPGGRWRFLDDTPVRRRVASGAYDVRVTLNPTGETKELRVKLEPGDNPPVRVAFGRGA